jgi:hypothetical protein
MIDSTSIRLCLLSEALDPEGQPRAALVVPPSPDRYGRPVTILYASLGAALAAKRSFEEATHARP